VLTGPEGAPAVLLAPSLGTELSMWDPQAEALAQHFRVIRFDLRGHGQSSAPDGPYTIDDLGNDLLALLDELEFPSASLCGVSIGGMCSMWAAAHAPHRVERLVVCCSSAFIDPDKTYLERAQTVRTQGLEPIADGVVARWFTPPFAQERPDVVTTMRERLVRTDPEGYAGCCEALAEMDLRTDLEALGAKTLVISGAGDQATPPEHGRAIAEAIPEADFEIVSGAAHLANVERPEAITELIINHLRRSG
jgi:3-oxoadipate enol-lactonase